MAPSGYARVWSHSTPTAPMDTRTRAHGSAAPFFSRTHQVECVTAPTERHFKFELLQDIVQFIPFSRKLADTRCAGASPQRNCTSSAAPRFCCSASSEKLHSLNLVLRQ